MNLPCQPVELVNNRLAKMKKLLTSSGTAFSGFKHALVFSLTKVGGSERIWDLSKFTGEREKKIFFGHLLLQLLCLYKEFYRCISTPEEKESNLTDQFGLAQVLAN